MWAASERPTQQTTPVSKKGCGDEEVTVTDPRHPLYGRTFRLIDITNKQNLERRCIVWLQDDIVERTIPLAATNLANQPVVIPSLPLDEVSVGLLAKVWERIWQGLNLQPEEVADEPVQPVSRNNKRKSRGGRKRRAPTAKPTRSGVGKPKRNATTSSRSSLHPGMRSNRSCVTKSVGKTKRGGRQ